MPDASFYLWPKTPMNDETFAKLLFAEENVTVLPGSKSAYFADYVAVAKAELKFVLGLDKCKLEKKGDLEFFIISAQESQLIQALSLSFVMGAFESAKQACYRKLDST